jgi:hypothetical protein
MRWDGTGLDWIVVALLKTSKSSSEPVPEKKEASVTNSVRPKREETRVPESRSASPKKGENKLRFVIDDNIITVFIRLFCREIEDVNIDRRQTSIQEIQHVRSGEGN